MFCAAGRFDAIVAADDFVVAIRRPHGDGMAGVKPSRLDLLRDPVCKVCSEAPSTNADHIVPMREGGAKGALDSLQGLVSSLPQREDAARRG